MKVTCSICKDVFSLQSEVYAVECGHLFHENCISKWCEKSPTCPHCRYKLKEPPFNVKFEVRNKPEKTFRESQCEQLLLDLQVLHGEEKQLKLKYENMNQKLAELRNEACDAEKKAKKMKYDVTVWKQEYNYLKKAHEMIEHLQNENKSLETQINFFTSLEKLMYGTEIDVNEVLVGIPITSSTIEELCKFVQAMKQKLKCNQDNYNEQNTKLIHLTEAMEKEYTYLERKKEDVKVLDKSVQTNELPIRKQKKRKAKGKSLMGRKEV